MTLGELLLKSRSEWWATAHFNISSLEQMRAIVEAALSVRSPVVIGTSEGERSFIGLTEAVFLRDAFRLETGIPIFLNADHSRSVESARSAVDAGYDSIHIDLSNLPFAENVAGTRSVVEYARQASHRLGYEINVEGELGLLRGESKIQKEVIEAKKEELTTPDEASEFVRQTGINRLAPAVGNIHGIAVNEKTIYPDLIRRIREALPAEIGLTLHGGSGVSESLIRSAIEAGINNIHINTEIRVAWSKALRSFLEEHPDETTPYKVLEPSLAAVRAIVEEKLKIFGSVSRV